MRLKHVPGSEEAVLNSPYTVNDPAARRGSWQAFFENTHPIHAEVGMGKGRFLTEMAELHPDINYLGIEKYTSVLIKAVKKQEEKKLPNLRFICMDAADITDVFAPGEIDRLYLNFSDPWPKDRHAKRRLTSPQFLKLWEQVLSANGTLEFKTDNMPLFDYSLEVIPQSGWELLAVTHDLHHEPSMNEGNVMTEYEEKFSSRGNPIGKLITKPLR